LLTYGAETKEPEIIRLATHLRFVSNYRPPELYGLRKVHKPGVPFRPIVSTINSTTSELSRYLKMTIKPLTGKGQSFVKNSKTFVNGIRNYHLETDEILVSYDVKELFPSIPISDTLDTLYNLLSADANLLSRTKLNPFHIIKLPELNYIRKIFCKNNYPRSFIDRVFQYKLRNRGSAKPNALHNPCLDYLKRLSD
ncbi:hypothetical protein M513_13180, partial [Trichuris suis]